MSQVALLSFQPCAVVQYTVKQDNVPNMVVLEEIHMVRHITYNKQSTVDYIKCECAKIAVFVYVFGGWG